MKTKIIPFFLSNRGCPFKCIYCNQFFQTGEISPMKSQLENFKGKVYEYLNTISRRSNRIEIAFFGGTFTGLEKNIQKAFLSKAKEFLDDGSVSSIRVSTHPLFIDKKRLSLLKEFDVETIELGVQSFNDKVLSFSKRGYSKQKVFDAIKLIKSFGFKLGIQLMTGLPYQSEKVSYVDSFYSAKLRPDFIRIYPCVVFKNTKLYEYYVKKIFTPWNIKRSISLVKKLLLYFYIRGIKVIRVGIHPVSNISYVVSGTYHPSFRLLCESALRYDLMKLIINDSKVEGNIVDYIIVYCSGKEVNYFRGWKNYNVKLFFNEGFKIDVKQENCLEDAYVEIGNKKYNLPYERLNRLYKKFVFSK